MVWANANLKNSKYTPHCLWSLVLAFRNPLECPLTGTFQGWHLQIMFVSHVKCHWFDSFNSSSNWRTDHVLRRKTNDEKCKSNFANIFRRITVFPECNVRQRNCHFIANLRSKQQFLFIYIALSLFCIFQQTPKNKDSHYKTIRTHPCLPTKHHPAKMVPKNACSIQTNCNMNARPLLCNLPDSSLKTSLLVKNGTWCWLNGCKMFHSRNLHLSRVTMIWFT